MSNPIFSGEYNFGSAIVLTGILFGNHFVRLSYITLAVIKQHQPSNEKAGTLKYRPTLYCNSTAPEDVITVEIKRKADKHVLVRHPRRRRHLRRHFLSGLFGGSPYNCSFPFGACFQDSAHHTRRSALGYGAVSFYSRSSFKEKLIILFCYCCDCSAWFVACSSGRTECSFGRVISHF